MELVDHQSKDMENGNTAGEVHAVRAKHGCAPKGWFGCGQSGHRMFDSECPVRGIKDEHYASYCKHRFLKGTVHSVEEKSELPEKHLK